MSSDRKAQSVASFARSVIETIEQEQEAMVFLDEQIGNQFDALRHRDLESIEAGTLSTTEAINRLERITQTRERQTRLLYKMVLPDVEQPDMTRLISAMETIPGCETFASRLNEVRTVLKEQAERTKQRSEELDFSLRYAARLTREIVQVIHDVQSEPALKVYTATGAPAQAPGIRSLMNRVG